MMIRTIKLFYVLATLLMVACATKDTAEIEGSEVRENVLQLAATSNGSSVLKRAMSSIQNDAFDADELLQAYVWHDADRANFNYTTVLTTMEAEEQEVGGVTKRVNPLHSDRYLVGPSDRTKTVSAYAFYPSWVNKDNCTAFTVSADQRQDGDATQAASADEEQESLRGYKGSDLMFGSRGLVPATESPLLLTFRHKMAKLSVIAHSDGSVTGIVVNSVTVKNVNRTVAMTFTENEGIDDATYVCGATSNPGDIQMTNLGSCLLPPGQEIGTTETFITVETNFGTANFVLGTALTLAEGTEYVFTLAIGTKALRQESTIITDWDVNTADETVDPRGEGTMSIGAIADLTYNGVEQEPADVKVYGDGGAVLTKGTDYTLSFVGNKDAGTGVVLAMGTGAYEGEMAYRTFRIQPRPLSSTGITFPDIPHQTYNGVALNAEYMPSGQNATDEALANHESAGTYNLIETTDFTVSDISYTNAGDHIVTFMGVGNYGGTHTKTFTIDPRNITDAIAEGKITISVPALAETGSQLTGVPTGKDIGLLSGDYTMVHNIDFTVENSEIQKTASDEYDVTFTGINNYTGTATTKFIITPKQHTYDCTKSVQTFTIPVSGYYKLQCYGAQGGDFNREYGGSWNYIYGAKGAYTKMAYYLSKGEILYIYVGGKGDNGAQNNGSNHSGGWNGGGSTSGGTSKGSGGGGATHIAKIAIGNITSSNNLHSSGTAKEGLLMVAGGGGGTWNYGGNGAANNLYTSGTGNSQGANGAHHSGNDEGDGGGGGGFTGGSRGGTGGTSWMISDGLNATFTGANRTGNGQAKVTWYGFEAPDPGETLSD